MTPYYVVQHPYRDRLIAAAQNQDMPDFLKTAARLVRSGVGEPVRQPWHICGCARELTVQHSIPALRLRFRGSRQPQPLSTSCCLPLGELSLLVQL
jgi:hypothetical protein